MSFPDASCFCEARMLSLEALDVQRRDLNSLEVAESNAYVIGGK